jgi:ribonuclease Z
MDSEQKMAAEKFHATARQAGKIARLANAKHLLIGHFSSRYKQLEDLLAEAKEEFQETSLANDGIKIEIR